MRSPRPLLVDLIKRGLIAPAKINDALTLTGVSPDGKAWRAFIDLLLLWLGGLALAFAVLFFVAYNWSELGRYSKFGLVEATMVLAVLAYWRLGVDTAAGKVSLFVATILLGVLLALYGQTYQTGADTWQLFFTWSMLMLPWAIVGRYAVIWALWIGLINLSIVLYYESLSGVWLVLSSDTQMYWFLFLFNTLALAVWESLSRRHEWLAARWAPRAVATLSGVFVTLLAVYMVFDREHVGVLPGLVWLGWLAAGYVVYRKMKPDLYMLAGGCLSSIVVIESLLSKLMLHSLGAGGYLLIAFVVIGLGAASAAWLKNVHRELRA